MSFRKASEHGRRNTLFSFFLFCLIIGQGFPALAKARSCRQIFADRDMHQVHLKNSYNVGRGLKDYITNFGEAFETRLLGLSSHGRWLDAGAGEALALRQYMALRKTDAAQVVAVAVKKPEHVPNEGYSYFEGRYVEEIPARELGRFEIITDVYGPLFYSSRADLVLAKYLEILKPEGSIFISGYYGAKSRDNLRIVSPRGETLDLIEWLKSIDGLIVQDVPERKGAYFISVRPETVPSVPKLELIEQTFSGVIPQRVFRVSD